MIVVPVVEVVVSGKIVLIIGYMFFLTIALAFMVTFDVMTRAGAALRIAFLE